jgi:hypothetical protein
MDERLLIFGLWCGGYVIALLMLIAASFTRRAASRTLIILTHVVLVLQGAFLIMAAVGAAGLAPDSQERSLVPLVAGVAIPFPIVWLWTYILSWRRSR